MSNRKKIASVAFTGAAMAAVTMMGGAPAFAGAPFTIKNGPKLKAPYAVKAKLKGGTSAVLVDVNKAIIKCKRAVISGGISQSAGNTPAQVGGLSSAGTMWASCAGARGQYKAQLVNSPKLIVSLAAGLGASGKLSENKISLKVSGIGLNRCKATISGTSIPVKYTNSKHSLAINPAGVATLRVKSTNGLCLGAFNAGDKASIAATYNVSAPASLTIS